MALASVLYPSPTNQGWNEWTFHNFQHHLAIDRALLQVKGILPVEYKLWPVLEGEFQDWLEQHQQAHTLFCEALGIGGVDLSDLDLKDRTKRDAWFYLHFNQHQAAAQVLGLDIL